MSQKSTARTGSEGDVEVKEIPPNSDARPGSSCKSKRDLLGGPFGDSPYDQIQDAYQEYLLIMFHNEDDTPGTSESSQPDVDLYNMNCNYTQQLNLVRKKFNLMELSEEEHQKCTITEILEDEPNKSNQRPVSCDRIFKETKGIELTTIHPFSLNYSVESRSSTNIFEPEYSPPTKKVCQRLKTPRFVSVSEGNVPYHTKVSINDSIFKKASNPQGNIVSNAKNFTETRQTQCNEEEFSNLQSLDEKFSILNLSFETGTESEYESRNSESLFPNVIVETKEAPEREESSLSSRSSKKLTDTSSSMNFLSLNSARGSSDEEDFYTVKMTKTTIASDRRKKSAKKTCKAIKELTTFEEIGRLRSGTNDNDAEDAGDGDGDKTGDASYDISKFKYVGAPSQNLNLVESRKVCHDDGKLNLNRYIRQYVQYKNEMDRLAAAKKRNKHTIIGQRLVNIQNRIVDSPDKLYQSENSLVSDEEKRRKVGSSLGDSDDSEDKRRFWERFCFCLCPGRNFDD